MKIILLAFLFVLLIIRVKSTPTSLSKKLWKEKMQKNIDNRKLSNNVFDEETYNVVKGIIVIMVILIEIILIAFYVTIGNMIGGTCIMMLSALQVFTCLYSLILLFDKSLFSDNIEDYKFRRWYLLLNTILDYIYYPLTIYMMLK